MNNLLIFFVLPIATIILAIVLQRILRCPILVAATAFAIYLIVTYTVFDSSFLIFAFIYTILAFLAAYITRLICNCRIFNCNNICNGCGRAFNQNNESNIYCSNNSTVGNNNDYNFYDNYSQNANFTSISSNNNPNFAELNYSNNYNVNNKNSSGTLYRCRAK